MIMSPATTRDQISAWKRSFEGRVVISSASGTERGEVFYGPTDWLGSCDPMTHYDYAPDSSKDWMTETRTVPLTDDSGSIIDTRIMLTVYDR
jgi:hypothetical protein